LKDGEKKESPCQLILGMIDVEGDQGQGQGLEIEDIDVDQGPDQDQEEDPRIAVTDAEVIVLELVHHPEDAEVENALEVEAEVAIDIIIAEVEDNYACKKTNRKYQSYYLSGKI